jgi:(R,R)-butanediol dehydrogenase/meso-butanediol dehydrogenase/diacetyl reductase
VCDTNAPTRSRRPNLSPAYATIGLQRHGGLAEYVAVPVETCVDVTPYGLTGDAAALAQPMAIAVHSLRRSRPEPGEPAVVIGAGGIGAFLVYAGAQAGIRLAVADLSTERLEIARALGAESPIGPDETDDLGEALASRGIEPTIVFEVTGTEAGLRAALAVSEPAGARIVLVGLHEEPRLIDFRRITLREIELIGTNAHDSDADLSEAVRLLAARPEGWADIAPEAFPLDELVAEGIVPIVERRARRIKTLIDPRASKRRATDTVPRGGALTGPRQEPRGSSS